MTTFKNLGLSDEVLKALSDLGFETPTEIQAQAIPQLLVGINDFIGLAQTGTGKTAAFGLPLLELLDPQNKSTQALILAPTRELGQQIAGQLQQFSKYLSRINVLAVYGGASIMTQMSALKRPQQVIIATPGRLIDLIKRKAVKLDQLRFLVLDEADEMLNMGFKEELDEILSHTPSEKLTWLFSATMPGEIKRIVKTYMDDPIEVRINPKNEVNTDIEHQYSIVKQSDKTEALTRFLDNQQDMRGIVFCRTKRDTQALAEELLEKNYKADAIHGDLSQQQRDRVMNRFKKHELQVLVATDVAARGIDVNNLTHVFHYTLPDSNSYYTHRSGRTARAGKKGISLAFINGREKNKIYSLERQLGISFSNKPVPNASDIAEKKVETWCKQILEVKTNGRLDDDVFNKAKTLFGNLSKEELISKILMNELEKLNLTSSKDLNEQVRRESKSHHKGDFKKDKRSGRGKRNRNNSRDRDRERDRRKKSRR